VILPHHKTRQCTLFFLDEMNFVDGVFITTLCMRNFFNFCKTVNFTGSVVLVCYGIEVDCFRFALEL